MKYRDPVCLISLLQSFQYWPGTVISEEMIRDRIVFGIQSEKIREKLINVGEDLTLDKAIQLAQAYEYSQEHIKLMGQSSTHVQAISKSRPTTNPSADKSGRRQATQPKMNPSTQKSYASKVKNPSTETTVQVWKATIVSRFLSSARPEQRCSNCHKWNHFC